MNRMSRTVCGLVVAAILAISSVSVVVAQEAVEEGVAEVEVAEEKAVVEKVIFSFEKDPQCWEIPDWAWESEDIVAKSLAVSSKYASDGKSSLEFVVDFPGGIWSGAVVEIMEYFDWTPYSVISADVYLPEGTPRGLRGKIVLTVGENWKWTEMSRRVRLIPGQWTTISANLKPGSTDWKKTQPTDEFRADVRKMVIRIESKLPKYSGPIYIDNIRLTE